MIKYLSKSVRCDVKVSEPSPVLVFDRGFARAEHVIKFLKEREMPFVMRIPRNVGIIVDGYRLMKLDDMENGWYPHILYQKQQQIPLQLYIIRDEAFDDPMKCIRLFRPQFRKFKIRFVFEIP